MITKSEIIESAMKLIDDWLFILNEESLDRARLSIQCRKVLSKKVDLMMPLDEEEFIRVVKRIFQNELQIELTRKVGVKP